MSQRTVLITGANRGIGLEFCRQYAERGDNVIAVCRRASPALQQLGERIIEGIDITAEEDVARLRTEVQDVQIDILINNAGLLTADSLDQMDFANIQRQFEVNAIGPLRVTHALLDRLSAGSKVALITSRMGSMADNGSGGAYGYRMSKAALNAAGVSLARDLEERQIPVILLHPGYVQTEMTGFNGDIQPEQAASRLITRIEELTLANSGTFQHSDGTALPW